MTISCQKGGQLKNPKIAGEITQLRLIHICYFQFWQFDAFKAR